MLAVEIREVVIPFDVEQKLIWKHDVQAYEVEEVFLRHPQIRFIAKGRMRGEDLYAASGQTDDGRYLIVFLLRKKRSRALVISAREMDAKERKLYGKKRAKK